MRRLVAAITCALLLLGAIATHAAGSTRSVTLLSPSEGDILTASTTISWSYSGFHPSVLIDIEAAIGDGPFQRLVRTTIDDGSNGDFGSWTWDTTTAADAADYTLRIVVPTNTAANDQAAVVVDNAAPEITPAGRTPANENGWNDGAVEVTWSCTDAVSGAVADTVTVVLDAEGTDQAATGTCHDRAGNTADHTVAGVNIDTTAPEISIAAAELDVAPMAVAGSAGDATSGVSSVLVTFTHTVTGAIESREASCAGCGSAGAVAWTVATSGLVPGPYQVTAEATDLAGHAAVAAASRLVVA